jgi:hypothetical protein
MNLEEEKEKQQNHCMTKINIYNVFFLKKIKNKNKNKQDLAILI